MPERFNNQKEQINAVAKRIGWLLNRMNECGGYNSLGEHETRFEAAKTALENARDELNDWLSGVGAI